jgi:naphthoate synthase
VYSFCSGGDQNARGHQGYVERMDNIVWIYLKYSVWYVLCRRWLCSCSGWAVEVDIVYVVCDLTLASKEHAIFKQTDAMLPVLMGIWFPHYLTKMVGRKKPWISS